CAVVRAQALRNEHPDAVRLADVFCERSRIRVKKLFDDVWDNADDATYKLAQDVLAGRMAWLEDGALPAVPATGVTAPASGPQVPVGKPVSGTRATTKVGASA
ncbi:MAG TPA: hypothetical protein VFH27_14390, partial [Longimicrobiaceae bacterium]|nr:hypothetical protein [Longimicrobiaceae bacterium]